ncbi:MAG: beta-galactosidase, partial [Planctomycetes bacterium]|nr:beta-galactosidase [Planctomycetota bacterium]
MRHLLFLLAAMACAADPAVTATLVTGNPAGLVAPGREADAALVIANPGGQPAEVALAGTITAFDGSTLPLSYSGTVAAGGEARIAIPLATMRRGHHSLAWKLTGAGASQDGTASLVYARPAGPGQDPAGFRYGLCSHPARAKPPIQEREMQTASQIGIGTMRIGVDWNGLEPKPGEWKWERLDALLDLTEKYRMQVQTGLSFCAMHGATPATMAAYEQAAAEKRKNAWHIWSRNMPREDAWRTYVRAIAERYKDRIAIWEVWNEPDLEGFWKGSTDDYIRLLRMSHEELKRVKPDAVVMSGGFAGVGSHPGHRLNPGLQERVLAEASDAFDIHAYHGHGTFMSFVQSVDGELARIRARMPQPRPLYFNETAMHSKFGTERLQAVSLVKKLPFARARGAVGFTWYDLRNDGTDPSDAEHNYGLVSIDFQPKAVYAAYNELIARMRGTRYLGQLDFGPGRYAYVFAGGGRRLMVAWNEEPGLPDDPVAVVADGCPGGECVDIMGNAVPLPGRGGALVVRLRDEPQWFELPGGESMPRVAGALVAVDGNT